MIDENDAVKLDDGKPRHDLLPPVAIDRVAEVLTRGAEKYGERNWEKGLKWGRLYAALHRHLTAFWSGEEFDPETGLHHMAHASCCSLMLLDHAVNPLMQHLDDRPKTHSVASFGQPVGRDPNIILTPCRSEAG
jgi:hypothetical protein